ncbi:cysteine proteinase [Clavulina sp. PMI_390]|nr:cysteine proteinase [Clavulina sp. PMI_390]
MSRPSTSTPSFLSYFRPRPPLSTPPPSSQPYNHHPHPQPPRTHHPHERRRLSRHPSASSTTSRSSLLSLSNASHRRRHQHHHHHHYSVTQKQPLIAATVPLTVLKSEYASPIVRAKIDWLSTPSNAKNTNKSQGWTGLRRTRGDGDCFYRSVAFSYVERILEARDQELAAASSLSTLEGWLMNLESVGFERGAFEDFYDALREIITNVFQPDETGSVLTPISLLERFQDPYISNSIVTFLRLLTSAYMRLNADDFAPFLLDPETFEQIDLVSFCSSQVECMGKEADHVQIQALTRALRIPVDIAYMDGNAALAAGANVSAGGDEIGKVDFVRFEVDGPAGSGDGAEPVTLLYRPGHYDILEKKDVLPLEGFVRERSIPFP